MTKSERLLYLISLLRQRGAASVAELSEQCRVSRRTIYRDLNSLSRMNIPIVYDNGYQLAHDGDLPSMRLGADELDLIRYACAHNPAAEYRFFRERFRLIEQKLSEHLQSAPGSLGRFLRIEGSHNSAEASSGEVRDWLRAFCHAIESRRKVFLELADSRSATGCYIPVCICLTDSGVILRVHGRENDQTLEFDCRRIRSVHVTAEVYSLNDDQ